MVRVFVSVKQAGKRKDYITKKELALKCVPANLRELITEIVSTNVSEYNNKPVEPLIMNYLSSEEITSRAGTGKVGFGFRRSEVKADVKQAIETAILAFEDGIYRVFIGEDEVTSLDEPMALREQDVLTFVRLTMLAGRMW